MREPLLFFNFVLQQAANIILILTAAIIGLLCYFLGEEKQRRAFLEAKQSLEVKMLIEEQSAEQVILILIQRNVMYSNNKIRMNKHDRILCFIYLAQSLKAKI